MNHKHDKILSIWSELKHEFQRLGGIAENVEPRIGTRGRGLFSINPRSHSKVVCPSHILLSKQDFTFKQGILSISRSANLSEDAIRFLEAFYNIFSWEGGGRSDARSFLEGIYHMPDSAKNMITGYNLIPENLLSKSPTEEHIFERFVSTRLVTFKKQQVLAPIWDLVNHSAFAPPFITSNKGVETPERNCSKEEILHKYSPMKSPLCQWASYGFACKSIVAYSIPLEINIDNGRYLITCIGERNGSIQLDDNVQTKNKIISIRSLPVGSMSRHLPSSTLKTLLRPLEIAEDDAANLMYIIQNINIDERQKLSECLEEQGPESLTELRKALNFEVEMIRSSVIT